MATKKKAAAFEAELLAMKGTLMRIVEACRKSGTTDLILAYFDDAERDLQAQAASDPLARDALAHLAELRKRMRERLN